MKIPALLAPALCLALAGCDDVAVSVVCPDLLQPAVVAGVFDGAGVSVAHEARGWYTVAGTTDSMRHTQSAEGVSQLSAYGPSGTYQVRVRHPGFAEWSMSGLSVPDASCGPDTRRINVQLQR